MGSLHVGKLKSERFVKFIRYIIRYKSVTRPVTIPELGGASGWQAGTREGLEETGVLGGGRREVTREVREGAVMDEFRNDEFVVDSN